MKRPRASTYLIKTFLITLGLVFGTALTAQSEDNVRMPVSINALMVTLIDHSAHYVWDYGAIAQDRDLSEDEWRIVEYYAVQLAASGPLITLGGTGQLDDAWSKTPAWIEYSQDLSDAAEVTLKAVDAKDAKLLDAAGGLFVDSCENCHNHFKPELPTEGFIHNPAYDHLYHLIRDGES